MIKDDNNIAIFTCVIVMVAVGMVLQRAEGVSDFFDFGSPSLELADDGVNARTNSLVRVDVLANDTGVSRDGSAGLKIVSQPACGHAVVRDDAVEFLANDQCSGIQSISYTVDGTQNIATLAAQVIGRPAAPMTAAAEGAAASGSQVANAAAGESAPVAASAATEPAVPESVQVVGENSAVARADSVPAVASQTAPKAGAAQRISPDTVRAVSGALPERPQGGDISDASLAGQAWTYGAETVAAADIAPLGASAGTDVGAEADDHGFLSALGFGAEQSDTSADVMMIVVERGHTGTEVPSAPQYGIVREPVAPQGDSEMSTSRPVSETLTAAAAIAAAPVVPVPTPSASVGEALSVTPIDPNQAAYNAETIATASPVRDVATNETTTAGQSADQIVGQQDAQAQEMQVARLPGETVETRKDVAALPSATQRCIVPPSLAMLPQRAAQTTLQITAPCQRDGVVEISYSDLRIAVALDADGFGEITLPGFEAFSPATVSFADGEVLDLELPFRDVQRVSRIAIAWNAPVALELNAMEFGTDFGGDAHVRPANPRNYDDIRRTGGGFLTEHSAIAGVGQNVQVYTHLHRQGGNTGVVKMMIDFASRSRERLAEACGDGAHAAPTFDVMRVDRGDRQRVTRRQLAAVACSDLVPGESPRSLISGAVEDLLVTPR